MQKEHRKLLFIWFKEALTVMFLFHREDMTTYWKNTEKVVGVLCLEYVQLFKVMSYLTIMFTKRPSKVTESLCPNMSQSAS